MPCFWAYKRGIKRTLRSSVEWAWDQGLKCCYPKLGRTYAMKMTVNDLKPGMKLARDLSQRGRILLKEGTELSEAVIETLKNRNISSVDITSECKESILVLSNADIFANPDYIREAQEIEDMFSLVGKHDEQMDVLKYCLIRQLGEKYRE